MNGVVTVEDVARLLAPETRDLNTLHNRLTYGPPGQFPEVFKILDGMSIGARVGRSKPSLVCRLAEALVRDIVARSGGEGEG